ncbi:MAG: SIS domain-containing protein [Candidatus Parvarchaeota archaeon]|jgi:phosphoheptose isomerase (EC 5.3.1.-)|nr:SIS domain-containing protein [Candidatus Parvarchaeota archaeon]MCL5101271.1 SIS domain-containing protein [Candidatus Parvarchaeota archaeon]
MDMKAYIREGIDAREKIDAEEISAIAKSLADSIRHGGKLIAFGNGGSAADAQHFVAELSGHFLIERRPLPAIALTTNTSAITAIGNDYSYEEIFSRQVSGIVTEKDFVVGISTSGNSLNVIRAIDVANERHAYTLALTGKDGGKLKNSAKKTIRVASSFTPIIQEVHIAIIHMVCMALDEFLGYQ